MARFHGGISARVTSARRLRPSVNRRQRALLHVVGGRDPGASQILAAALAECGPVARRLGEQRELVEILLDHRRQHSRVR